MQYLKLGIIFSLLAVAINSQEIRYDNYRLYKIFTGTERDLRALQSFQTNHTGNIEFWKESVAVGDDCDVMVSPEKFTEFHDFLAKYGLKSAVSIENIQKVIDEQSPKARGRRAMEWENYHTLDEIFEWLDKIEQDHPSHVTPFKVGKSYEGRDVRGIKISYKEGNRAIFIEANMHAREWISSATITWIIDQLLTSTDPGVRDLAENIDWYIIPVLNPDGFVYTHEKNRMWRKTRQPHNPKCVGADPNRNWDFLWLTAGSSTDPCSETYAGPRPNSEPEIQGLINYIESLPRNIIVYISMHSYGQLVLSPWGHTDTEFPENYQDMLKVAAGYADGVRNRFGTEYRYGSSSTVLYKVSGSSKEWAYGVRGIPITYTIELRDQGRYGFILPPEQIIPTAQEVLDGFIGLVRVAKEINYF